MHVEPEQRRRAPRIRRRATGAFVRRSRSRNDAATIPAWIEAPYPLGCCWSSRYVELSGTDPGGSGKTPVERAGRPVGVVGRSTVRRPGVADDVNPVAR